MVGYMDREAYEETRRTGWLHFHSRSRGVLWKKGESSRNLHRVVGAKADCDGDALLLQVEPLGPTCHTGAPSCFAETLWGKGSVTGTVARLEEVIASRKVERPEGSYTARLLSEGTAKVAQKVGEEAVETVVAALAQDKGRLVEESADLLYHLMVLWADRGVTRAEVLEELEARMEGGR